MSRHAVMAQRPDDELDPRRAAADPAVVAQYASTLLPGVLWALGMFVFDGTVPAPLQGTVGLVVTGLCTIVVGCSRRYVHRLTGD